MRILALHGRGSNTQIFTAQLSPLAAHLPDIQFDHLQGTVRHTEGNWSLHTTAFSRLPLYTYYNPLDPRSILQTETELEALIARDGPFDGVLGYSGGAALAAEILCRDVARNPLGLVSQRPFRFAVFINGASPLRVFRLDEVDVDPSVEFDADSLVEEARSMFLRPSALRRKEGVSVEDQADHEVMLGMLERCRGMVLRDGTKFISDGEFGLCRFERRRDDGDDEGEALIDVPTLHVRSIEEDETNPHHGLHLLSLCDRDKAREFHHEYGHDFPRGRVEMMKIAQLIRETAEASVQ
ncbi:hypothetical protein PMZ80_008003 [Knufia obscura]|uniref:Serine hydrolase domain-containing protein n=2 Tax=Knufia TaxID=430999 RepID=A0AAN8F5T1_9EURO|nr:hypothetical protein PMZ80_008003 [Knufia obscura]KAK5957268.1 hypothetical protein OHC33_001640 [Knufia fluminis]